VRRRGPDRPADPRAELGRSQGGLRRTTGEPGRALRAASRAAWAGRCGCTPDGWGTADDRRGPCVRGWSHRLGTGDCLRLRGDRSGRPCPRNGWRCAVAGVSGADGRARCGKREPVGAVPCGGRGSGRRDLALRGCPEWSAPPAAVNPNRPAPCHAEGGVLAGGISRSPGRPAWSAPPAAATPNRSAPCQVLAGGISWLRERPYHPAPNQRCPYARVPGRRTVPR